MEITELRKKGLSVTAIAARTGLPPRRVAGELGIMWDGMWPEELHREADQEREIERLAAEERRREEIYRDAVRGLMVEHETTDIPSWTDLMGGANWRPVSERPRGNKKLWCRALVAACRELRVDILDAFNRDDHRPRVVRARHIARVALLMRGHTTSSVGAMAGCDHTTVRNSKARMMADTAGLETADRVARSIGRVRRVRPVTHATPPETVVAECLANKLRTGDVVETTGLRNAHRILDALRAAGWRVSRR